MEEARATEQPRAAGVPRTAAIGSFREAGRTLFSLKLVRGSEGNLSTFDGRILAITRAGCALSELTEDDLVVGTLDGPGPGASSDLEVHRAMYRRHGPGAIVHSHPPGSIPEGGGGPGRHGMYVFAPALGQAVSGTVERVRSSWGDGSDSPREAQG